jgi:hypothetical protein
VTGYILFAVAALVAAATLIWWTYARYSKKKPGASDGRRY